MMGRTHTLIGIAALYAAHASGLHPLNSGVEIGFAAVGALIGSTLPDVDLRVGIPHRTYTHNILIPLGMFFINHSQFVFGLALAYLFHILADCLTVMGVPILYPLFAKRLVIRGPVHTGGISEWVATIAILFLGWRLI
jgi:membrane-bound metal-dependent hydrolase YbcI (DUF457 family)